MINTIRKHRKKMQYSTTPHSTSEKVLEECEELIHSIKYHSFKKQGLEMADVIITIVGYCESIGLDVESLVEEKIMINERR